MIFSAEESSIIQDVLQRKQLELSIYSSMESLPILMRTAISSQLELDIQRCESLLRIARNDFSHLDEDLEVLSPHQINMPMDLLEHYLTSLSEEDMRSEGSFMFYCNAGMDFFCRMVRSKMLADEIESGVQLVTYSDFAKLQLLTQIFTDAKAICQKMSDEDDLPYRPAYDYSSCMLEECSILKKIYLSKQMSIKELCDHVDSVNRVSPDGFNKLFLPELSPEIKGGLETFEHKEEDRLDLLYAQIIVSSKLGF